MTIQSCMSTCPLVSFGTNIGMESCPSVSQSHYGVFKVRRIRGSDIRAKYNGWNLVNQDRSLISNKPMIRLHSDVCLNRYHGISIIRLYIIKQFQYIYITGRDSHLSSFSILRQRGVERREGEGEATKLGFTWPLSVNTTKPLLC